MRVGGEEELFFRTFLSPSSSRAGRVPAEYRHALLPLHDAGESSDFSISGGRLCHFIESPVDDSRWISRQMKLDGGTSPALEHVLLMLRLRVVYHWKVLEDEIC